MKKRIAAGFLSILFAFTSASGCGVEKQIVTVTQQLTAKHVLKVDGEDYTLSQAKVYLVNYQNIYGVVSGVDLWETDSDHQLEDYVKSMSISQMTKILSMASLARSKEIDLKEQELLAVKRAAKAYLNSLSDEEKDYLNVSEAELEQMYEDYALAQKLYKSLTADINVEVSDDEARIMDAMQIFVSDKTKIKAAQRDLNAGMDFLTVASAYNEAKDIKISFGRGDLPEKIENAAFSLENGELTNPMKMGEGYSIIYCVNKFNQDLTDLHKVQIVQQREKEAFGDVYDAYSRSISKKLYQKNWDSVTVESSAEIKTDCFFEIYQEYCGDMI